MPRPLFDFCTYHRLCLFVSILCYGFLFVFLFVFCLLKGRFAHITFGSEWIVLRVCLWCFCARVKLISIVCVSLAFPLSISLSSSFTLCLKLFEIIFILNITNTMMGIYRSHMTDGIHPRWYNACIFITFFDVKSAPMILRFVQIPRAISS